MPDRGLIVDIGGVLATTGPIDVVDRWAPRLGLDRARLLAAVYGGNDDTVLVGRVTEDEWWRTVADRIGADVRELRRDLESGQVWDRELAAVVRDARSSVPTAILSNAWPSQHRAMREAEVHDIVDHVLLSCDIGVAKPDPAAFQIALDRLGTAPERTLFVDDTPGHVEAAASLGLRGLLHVEASSTAAAIDAFVRS